MKNVRVVLLLVSILIISLLVTSGAVARAPEPIAPQAEADFNQPVSSGEIDAAQTHIWTAEEMQNAIPYPLPAISMPLKDGTQTAPEGPMVIVPGGTGDDKSAAAGEDFGPLAAFSVSETAGDAPTGYSYPPPFTRLGIPWNYLLYPFRTLGKVFFTDGGVNYVCSASVAVNRAVWTAGHCVYNNNAGRFHTNWVFVPAYRNGAAPFGQWTASELWTTVGYWNGYQSYDIGMAVLNNRNGRTIAQTVGWLGFMANASRIQHWMAFGYPHAAPFAGQYIHMDAASHARDDGNFTPNPIGIGNDMTGGSSGGPWIVKFDQYAGGFNFVNGVNSYKYVNPNQPLQMYSPYFGDAAVNLYNAVRNR